MSDSRPKLIGIIPARWGSTRFPGKPLAELAGKTVIERVVERTLTAGVCDAVLVATDDDRIAQAAERAGADTRMTDPKLANGTLRSHAALVQWESDQSSQADWILNIQGDEPFVHPEQLQKLAQLREPVDEFFDQVMVMADDQAIRDNRLALLFSLRQLFINVADISQLAPSK